jgi:YD repeat-containing protein
VSKITSQSVVIDLTYDQRGNVLTEKRTIGGQAYTVAYVYDKADRVTQITYPSGRVVTYVRAADGRISGVTTKQNATAAVVNLASSIVYQPLSGVVQSMVYSNGLNDFNSFTPDGEIDVLGTYNGAASVINRSHTRTDNQNLTNIFDNVTTANTSSYWMEPAGKLQNADGPWGSKTFYYDGVGNRVTELSTPVGGAATTDTYGYPVGSNRLVQITREASTRAAMTYDPGGNLLTDSRLGLQKTYTYNNRNRMATATVGANAYAYTYSGREQLAIRQKTAGVAPLATTHFVHDIFGNVLAETSGVAAGTFREYIWLPETEIAPTRESMSQVDRPLAVVNGVGATGIAVWNVSVDHLNRPVLAASTASPAPPPSTPASPANGTKPKPACTTTGTGSTIRPLAGIRRLIRSGLSTGRACMGTWVGVRKALLTLLVKQEGDRFRLISNEDVLAQMSNIKNANNSARIERVSSNASFTKTKCYSPLTEASKMWSSGRMAV